MIILETKNLSYSYQDGGMQRQILIDINLSFEKGKMYAIVGKSGAGKTTLLSLLSGLDTITAGDVFFAGKSIQKIGYNNYRRNNVGIVFQNYNLLPYMNAVDNIRVATGISSNKNNNLNPVEILELLEITADKMQRPVVKLSGGEQQRVAIARAIATDVEIIFADEPTGNLDEKTANEIIDVLKKMAREKGKCVIIVTHAKDIAEKADQIITLKAGNVVLDNSVE
jgi:ABC-type antimicrobial peptide transport system, ATPase component